MAQLDWHEFANGYRFQETLHGPNVDRECMDCGLRCYASPSWPTPRCEKCLKRKHGMDQVVRRAEEDHVPG